MKNFRHKACASRMEQPIMPGGVIIATTNIKAFSCFDNKPYASVDFIDAV